MKAGSVVRTPEPNPPSMTLAEFEQIAEGMSRDEVAGIVGADGELLSESHVAGYETVMLGWDGTGSVGANANVMFQNGVVVSKA